jgi:hypothetical protein
VLLFPMEIFSNGKSRWSLYVSIGSNSGQKGRAFVLKLYCRLYYKNVLGRMPKFVGAEDNSQRNHNERLWFKQEERSIRIVHRRRQDGLPTTHFPSKTLAHGTRGYAPPPYPRLSKTHDTLLKSLFYTHSH